MKRLILALALLLTTAAAFAQNDLVKLDDVHSGTMLIQTTQPGLYIPAPAVDTDVKLHIRGLIVRGQVTQTFRNPASTCAEAIYAFPLPENATVDRMRLTVGQRVIEGEIKERGDAKKVYEQAKSEGKHASLLEQERPNIFTVNVANIAAGEEVVVAIEYQQTIEYRDGAFSLRFPTTIAPRYVPNGVVDAIRISPPVTPAPNPIHITVDLDAGFALREIDGVTHKIDATPQSGSHYVVRLENAQVPADRDFELRWLPDLGSEPKSAVFTESSKSGTYALIMMMPPQTQRREALPKESIFVIVNSGSMEGTSLNEAKTALQLALDRLSPRDRFNVMAFHDHTVVLWPDAKEATKDAVGEAKSFVDALKAESGTEMLPALEAALNDTHADSQEIRQVIFMTDGQVGNESELFQYIQSHLGRSRLFTVGIGNAPNSHFMRSASRLGRGTFTYIGDIAQVQEKMTSLFEKLESPVLSDVEIRFDDPAAEMWPRRIPDLYAGQPVIVAVKLSQPNGRVVASGRLGTTEWSDTHSVASNDEESGIAKLWARQQIESIVDEAPSDMKQKVTDVALQYHLVTEYTSLVAVDRTPADAKGAVCEARKVPVTLAAGWHGTTPDGSLPQTATPAPLMLIAGALLLGIAALIARMQS